jgi:GrpB-like predicted nucleotidyltransferase (UPF0157 family)
MVALQCDGCESAVVKKRLQYPKRGVRRAACPLMGQVASPYPTVIHEYDLTWPERFAALAARVETALGDIMLRAEHVGSTAVPGLAAKPIIDLDVVIAQASFPEATRRLGRLGYVHEGDLGITGREAFRWPPDCERHHLYVVAEESAELGRHLAFRDALRADPVLRDKYAALKRSLAAQHPHDIKAYTEGKTAFIKATLKR